MTSMEPLRTIAEAQWGLVTAAQAGRYGVDRVALSRLAASGALERLAHGLYRVRGGGGDVPYLGVRGAWLRIAPAALAEERLWSPDAVVSHRTAARLLDLGDLPEEPYEFTVPVRRQTRDPLVRFHRAVVPDGDWTVVGGLPVTVARRVVTDLLAERVDGGHVASMVAAALRRGLADHAELAAAMGPYAAAYGVAAGDGAALLEYLLELAGESPRQVAEYVDRVLSSPAGTYGDAATALAAVARSAGPRAPDEVLALVRATADAVTAWEKQAALDPVAARAMADQAAELRRALDHPFIRTLQRDAALRQRLANQARATARATRPAW